MQSAKAVANYFLARARQEGIAMDQLKIQKLLYYAYAWYMANNDGEELFPEDIFAWPHGPVVREVWREFRDYGRSPITKLASDWSYHNGLIQEETPLVTDPKITAFLNEVWDSYKLYTGIQLSNMTHAEDEPWAMVRRKADLRDRPRIPNDLIYATFAQKISRAASPA